MFVGHLAVGFAGKRVEPRISLGTWILAVLLADLIVFPLLIAGLEHFAVVPGVTRNRMIGEGIVYSHSLVMDMVWAALFAGAYLARWNSWRGTFLLFGAVTSHWPLDTVSHRPDMAIAPGLDTVFGLGLWNSIPATFVIEGGLWLLAIVIYTRATYPRGRAGIYAFWCGVLLLTMLWFGNITRGMDPDPVRAGIGGLVLFSIVIAWAYWIDRLRPAQKSPRP